MINQETYNIRGMTIEDYDQVYQLWSKIKGFGIRSMDDSREGIERFLKRNPTTSVVAEAEGKIVGAILCGHDGRRGCLYHVCVDEKHRMHGIGRAMVVTAMEALKEEKINKGCSRTGSSEYEYYVWSAGIRRTGTCSDVPVKPRGRYIRRNA